MFVNLYILLLRFLRTYNNMPWGCPGMIKSRNGMDVVSNRWEFIISLFRSYILLGSQIFKFKHFET